MTTHNLTVNEQLREISFEFYDEAEAFKIARSPIERQIALNHINALLDAYNVITVELAYTEGQGTE